VKHLAEFAVVVVVLPAHILGLLLTLFDVAAYNLIWGLGFAQTKMRGNRDVRIAHIIYNYRFNITDTELDPHILCISLQLNSGTTACTCIFFSIAWACSYRTSPLNMHNFWVQ
jgi:hypothetical protein